MPLNDQELCACGKPLHYVDQHKRRIVEEMITRQGPDVRVTVTGRGTWLIPRHYIALHSVVGHELPDIAKKLGFKKIE